MSIRTEKVALVVSRESYIHNLMKAKYVRNLMREKYDFLVCEQSAINLEKLDEKDLTITRLKEAIPLADIVVMVIPDTKLSNTAKKILPLLKGNAIMIVFDPGITYSDDFPRRRDVTYVVTHSCHPTFFREQENLEARKDYLGSATAIQDITIALLQGSDENFEKAQKLCRKMFAPVDRCFRVTPEQMAILEPALGEVIGCSTAEMLKEAVQTAVNYGVPKKAAESFLLGHTRFALAVSFGEFSAEHPKAARVAIDLGKKWIFTSNWKKVFGPEVIRKTVNVMLHPEKIKE